ncbi:MAG: 1-deoxy-D-xylulose-5-phosphate reductoisomerase [Lachnospiraceae bacterium]|nr:1-deoxy-D-xylulose-5-phosphate reductoisomerase [Lachnospiraceae bacterium]
MKKISVLGSTGSIGTQTLEVVRQNKDELEVFALAAGTNVDLIEEQIREFMPKVAAMGNEKAAAELKTRISDLSGVKVLAGMDGLLEMASDPGYDIMVTAIVGMIGIRPTIAAIEAGKDIALANKETLVCAGHIIMPLAEKKGIKILPVDSEHSAIFQSLQGSPRSRIEKIILTCSGGPFRGMKKDELAAKTPEDALKHPNWNMGKKITIDSASLVNKGLEVMEASWLFGVGPERVCVTVHPQSVLHSAVEFADGAVVGQMGTPDMKLPINYALFYPDRKPMNSAKLDLFETAALTFEKPDTETFRGLALALDAAKTGGTMPTVFNAANEEAVARFLDHKTGFLGIYEDIEKAMSTCRVKDNPTVEEILDAERQAREAVLKG